MIRRFALLLGLIAGPAAAAECRTTEFDGAPVTWCVVDMERETLRTFLNDGEGRIWGSFRNLDAALALEGKRLGVAMNAGMYHQDRRPVGLYIEDGDRVRDVVTRAGPGNFGMLPNGVLCLGDDRAQVIESRAYAAERPACRYATQSGPLLVMGGVLHPKLLPDSDSRYVRNGVGVRPGGREVVLAISDVPVNFDLFARFFRDVAETPDALYLDGNVSRLYAPGTGRTDGGLPMGPILGTVVPAP